MIHAAAKKRKELATEAQRHRERKQEVGSKKSEVRSQESEAGRVRFPLFPIPCFLLCGSVSLWHNFLKSRRCNFSALVRIYVSVPCGEVTRDDCAEADKG